MISLRSLLARLFRRPAALAICRADIDAAIARDAASRANRPVAEQFAELQRELERQVADDLRREGGSGEAGKADRPSRRLPRAARSEGPKARQREGQNDA